MRYSKPAVQSFLNMHIVAESQYFEGLIPDPNGCPTFLFNEATGSGVISVAATYTLIYNFSGNQTCQDTVSMTGQATFEGNVLVPDCSNASFSCSFSSCNATGLPTGGQLCLTSLTLNGELQDASVCIDLNLNELDAVVGQLCTD